MLNMENAEEVMQILERFTRLKQKEIPKELDDYMHYVAKTGDTVFKWSSLKYLFREKLLNVIKNFHDTTPRVDDLPQYPNVDPFNYESMKSSLLERLELFNAAPFTVQRLCELLTEPRKQYSRIDKFMRALEKNILVSTIEPGRKQTESENGDSLDSVVNGDVSLDVNVDIEMENDTIFNAADAQNNATPSETPAAQPSSNLIHKSDDDILPNPKKAKLDLDENNDAEIEAATKSIASNNKPETTTIIPSVEVTMTEESTDSTEKSKQNDEPVSEDKPAAVENVVESIKKDNKDAEHDKMEEDLPASASIDDIKDEAKSDVKELDKKPEETDATTVPAPTAQLVQEESEQPKTEVEATATNIKAVEKDSVDQKEDSLQEQTTEKTKEVAEKENAATNEGVQNGDVKPSEIKTETNITTVEATNDKQSEMVVEGQTVDSSAEKKAENVLKNENAETVEASVAEAFTEKHVDSKVVSAADEKLADSTIVTSEEKSKSVEETKSAAESLSTMEVDAAAQAKIVSTESPQNQSVATGDEAKSTEVTEKETDKTEVEHSTALEAPTAKAPAVAEPSPEKPIDAPAVEAPSVIEKAAIVEHAEAEKVSVEQPATEKAVEKVNEEKADADKAEIEKTVTENQVSEKPEIEIPENAAPQTAETPVVAPPTDNSHAPIASSEMKPEVAAPTTTVTTPVAAAVSPAVPPAVEPVITADQPMDENPESIAEAEPVVPAIIVDTAATVEEVVMGGDSVEMATDAIEPSKDEPAGMEVDDTSQEAMDQ